MQNKGRYKRLRKGKQQGGWKACLPAIVLLPAVAYILFIRPAPPKIQPLTQPIPKNTITYQDVVAAQQRLNIPYRMREKQLAVSRDKDLKNFLVDVHQRHKIDNGKFKLNIEEYHAASGDRGLPIPALGTRIEFNHLLYLKRYPDLKGRLHLYAEALQHYKHNGFQENRIGTPLRLILRYTACGGLINQQYSHIAAFAVALQMGAEVVMPPALYRDSFGSYYSMNSKNNKVVWTAAPIGSLLNIGATVAYWQKKGLLVYQALQLEPVPDVTHDPQFAFQNYSVPGFQAAQHVAVSGVFRGLLPLKELVAYIENVVLAHAAKVLINNPQLQTMPPLIVDLPCTFFSLDTLSELRFVEEIAMHLPFSEPIFSLAASLIALMRRAGARDFNGLHLRVERDARDWTVLLGGPLRVWAMYEEAMKEQGFNAGMDVYIASGLLSYGQSMGTGGHSEFEEARSKLRSSKLARNLLYKESFLPEKVLNSLTSEQKALLDFAVLVASHNFVGLSSSTFSFFIREYRNLQGRSRESSSLINCQEIGTEKLFYLGAYLKKIENDVHRANSSKPN